MANADDRLLERQQNRLRGALAQTRRHFANTNNRELFSRLEIRRALLETRKDLPRTLRPKFFEWLERLRGGFDPSLEDALLQDLTNSVIKSEEIDIRSELEWIAFRLAPYIAELETFRHSADRLNSAFWSEDADATRAVLDEIRARHGDSLWLINATIAITQHFSGLEAQKDSVAAIRRRYPGGLPAYLAFFISARNEQRATVALFDEDLTDRLNAEKISDDLKSYIRFKLMGAFDCSEAATSAVLRAEQSQAIIDLYETSLEVLQRCVAQRKNMAWRGAAIALLRKLEGIGDVRVEKLLFALTGDLPLTRRNAGPGDRNQTFVKDTPNSFWSGVWHLATTDEEWSKDDRNDALLAVRLRALFGSLLTRDRDFEDSRARTAKFARNFSFLPSVRALGDFYKFITLEVENTPKALGATSLNSSSYSGADVLYVDDDVLSASTATLQSIIPPSKIQEWAGQTNPRHAASLLPVAWYARILRLSVTDADQARDAIEEIDNQSVPIRLQGLFTNLEIQLLLDAGDLNAATKLIGHAVSLNPSTALMMPAREAIGGRNWEALSTVPDKIDLAITLLAYWRQTDDSLHATYLRFAFEEVLAQQGAFFPGEITPNTLKSDIRLLLFASEICVPPLMDTSGLFVSSAELLDERLKILMNLVAADSLNREEYLAEVSDIHAQKLIKSGLEIVDSNRVSVDMDALARWATKRYRESYLRYQALRAAGVGVATTFEKVMESIKLQTHAEGEYFSIPTNEADTLLLEVILALKNQFLTDSQYGLEYFLGKRIRHGTIAGHMRGPAESRNLITERRSVQSAYEPNTFWFERMNLTDVLVVERAGAAFDSFSESYDNLIAEVRDRYLHVKSANHPDGLFDIVVTTAQYHLLRSLAGPEYEFDSFLSVVLNSFWSLLTPSLSAAKEFLGSRVKSDVVRLFAELQGALQESVPEEAYRNVSIAIQETSAEVQRELDTVVGWFDRIESKHATHAFALEEVVEIAIASALKSLTNFTPEIDRTVTGDVKATAAVLIVVTDIIFVVLDNVYRRARVGPKPEISIFCGIDAERNLFEISALNPIGGDVDLQHLDRRIETVRSKIAAGDIATGAAADKGSGLLKVASIVRQYSGAKLEFGIEGERNFRTRVFLPLFISEGRSSLLPGDTE